MGMISLSGGGVPVGAELPFHGGTVPDGFLLMYGQTVNIADYPALYLVLGTTHGGDGVTTFGIPDSRGRVTAGKDNMGGVAANRITLGVSGFNGQTLGAVGGGESHTLVTGEMPSHTHTQNAHSHSYTAGGGISGAGGLGNSVGPQSTPSVNSATATNNNNGSSGAHRNMQPTLIANKIIKY